MTPPVRRMTRQKTLVRSALGAATGFVSAQDLFAQLTQSGARIGLATVYRTLNELAEAGFADVLASPGGETLYRGCASGVHHHHLVCRRCGTTVEIHSDVVEDWAHRAARAHGFSEIGHVLDICGVCADCANLDSPSTGQTG